MIEFRLHHIGYLVADVSEASRHFLGALGYHVESDPIDDVVQTARVQFLRQPESNEWLELVQPLGEDSKLQAALQRGIAWHHLCYEVDDVVAGLAQMRQQGCMPLGAPVPGAAYDGRPIAWVMNSHRGLIELVEAGPGARSLAAMADTGELG